MLSFRLRSTVHDRIVVTDANVFSPACVAIVTAAATAAAAVYTHLLPSEYYVWHAFRGIRATAAQAAL